MDGLQKHEITSEAIEPNAKIIEKTAEDAAVLLKNDDHALPIKASELNSVVLIGPTASQVDSIGISGERSIGLSERQVGPLAAMKKVSGNANIQFAVADNMNGVAIPSSVLATAASQD
jgi:beta-glucosidase